MRFSSFRPSNSFHSDFRKCFKTVSLECCRTIKELRKAWIYKLVLKRVANKSWRQFSMLLTNFFTFFRRTSKTLHSKVIFSKANLSSREPTFYTEHVKIGMMKASDTDKVDMISPFFGAMVDRCCEIGNVDATVALYRYIGILYTVYCSLRCGLVSTRNDWSQHTCRWFQTMRKEYIWEWTAILIQHE